jgi:hypothetical protein
MPSGTFWSAFVDLRRAGDVAITKWLIVKRQAKVPAKGKAKAKANESDREEDEEEEQEVERCYHPDQARGRSPRRRRMRKKSCWPVGRGRVGQHQSLCYASPPSLL